MAGPTFTERLTSCSRCTRLVAWREEVARVRVRRFRDQVYWGRPVPGFGDLGADLLVVGLAPAAHGANRTGRMFTGDSSGDWLTDALYQSGFANQPYSLNREDGLVLTNAYLTAAVHCVPPDNRPTPDEITACSPYLREEWAMVNPRVVMALGQLAHKAVVRLAREQGVNPVGWRFSHGSTWSSPHLTLIASYHPSRQNTQTGRLTRDMLEAVFAEAARVLQSPPGES